MNASTQTATSGLEKRLIVSSSPVQVKIGDSVVMIGGTTGGDHAAPAPAHLYLLVDDVDASYKQALDAGATAVPGQVPGNNAVRAWTPTQTVLDWSVMHTMTRLLHACECPPSRTSIVRQRSSQIICQVIMMDEQNTGALLPRRNQLTKRSGTAWPALRTPPATPGGWRSPLPRQREHRPCRCCTSMRSDERLQRHRDLGWTRQQTTTALRAQRRQLSRLLLICHAGAGNVDFVCRFEFVEKTLCR